MGSQPAGAQAPLESRIGLYAVCPTRFEDRGPRFELAVRFVEAAAAEGAHVVLVDASRDAGIGRALHEAGATVFRQESRGKKGAALREGVRHVMAGTAAAARDGEEPIILYCEAEKADLARHLGAVARATRGALADVAVVGRTAAALATYPVEQQHSEAFGNHAICAAARDAGLLARVVGGGGGGPAQSTTGSPPPPLDFLFGPIAFTRSTAHLWLSCRYDMWLAQLAPVIRVMGDPAARVLSFPVEYRHGPAMRAMEEGSLLWARKRLDQLQRVVLPLVRLVDSVASGHPEAADGPPPP